MDIVIVVQYTSVQMIFFFPLAQIGLEKQNQNKPYCPNKTTPVNKRVGFKYFDKEKFLLSFLYFFSFSMENTLCLYIPC